MRHRKQGRALSRNASHRRAMLANLATAVLGQERVQTTTAKAKEARRLVDRMITFAKRNDLHARRQVMRVIRKQAVVSKLFSTIAPRYMERPGGYTRIIHVGQRQGDGAELSILELVGQDGEVASAPKEEKARPSRRQQETAEETTDSEEKTE